MEPRRQPLPGLIADVTPGDRVRVTTEVVVERVEDLPGEETGMVRQVTTAYAKSAARMIDGAWWVEVTGIGLVPATRVRRIEG